jgi:hypothetical protein
VLLLVAARQIADAVPRAAVVLASTASLGVILALPLWLAAVLAVALGTPARAWNRVSERAAARNALGAAALQPSAPPS